MKMISAGRKVNTIEERRRNESCLYQRGDYRNKGYNPENYWVRMLVKIVFCRSVTKQDRRTGLGFCKTVVNFY
jgi:hypothetical protein